MMRDKTNRTSEHIHLVIEDFGLASLRVGDQALIEDVENILADLLELRLDLGAVIANDGNVLFRALALFLLFNRRDDAPRRTTGTDNILVGNAEKVTLVDGELAAQLGDLLHIAHHLIVALGLLAKASQEGLAVTWARNQKSVESWKTGRGPRR